MIIPFIIIIIIIIISMKTECDYLYDWTKQKQSHMQKSHKKWWTLEIAGNIEEE